jgi:pSer/pThr/pTyr-binding forkhead associated (FHA) protein/tRNA A-37 threonylcarbamoyl transferase component Bud32
LEGPKAEIVVQEGVEKGRVLSLRPSKVIEIGREGNFRLEDPALSRHHCKVRFDGADYRLEDPGSTWGTFVNGAKVKSYALRSGDRIKIGNHVLLFRVVDAPDDDIPAAPRAGPAVARALPVDEEEIPSAPTAASTGAFARSDLAEPEEPAPTTSAPEEDPAEIVEEGICFNCGKPAPPDGPPPSEDPMGGPPRPYCANCREQYPLLGRVIANHLCEKVLGAGGMGIVYRGLHVVMGRRAALKTLRMMTDADPTMVKRLLREATAGGRIHHNNIVAVHDTGEQEGVAYVVMEYVRGENLSEALRRERKFTPKRALHMATQVAEALAAAFKLGYIHRDIKPENILLMHGDVVKVTDFGLAKNLKEGELGGLTRTGQVLGTMLYMPPEQIVSSKGSDQRADIYSLGATLFHLVAGRPVFDSKSAIALLMDIRTKQAPELSAVEPGVPPALDRVVGRCLKKLPAERYQTPEELVADMRAAKPHV